jgi:hypothetical protein
MRKAATSSATLAAVVVVTDMARHLIRRRHLLSGYLRRCRAHCPYHRTFIYIANRSSWDHISSINISSSIHSVGIPFRMDRLLPHRRILYWHLLKTTAMAATVTCRCCHHFRVRRVQDLGVAAQPIIHH